VASSRPRFAAAVAGAALVVSTLIVSGQAPTGAFEVVAVRDNLFMVVPPGDGANLAIQVGPDGALLVDTPAEALVPDLLALVDSLAGARIAYAVNTSVDPAHIGGNASMSRPEGFVAGRGFGGVPDTALGGPVAVSILAHENVLNRLVRDGAPAAALPSVEYFLSTKDFSMNGEAIIVYHAPAAITDGDSLVLFRSSDVLATGDVYTPDRYPMIDLAAGGSVQGLIDALNQVLHLTVPRAFQEGGTKVVPGHGRLSEEADVVEYRDMVVIIRDRVRALAGDGASLADVLAARPSVDYDREYQSTAGPAPDEFVETIYRSLQAAQAR
jgi:glyoxylase-like metal-dependent hydrolase (beta-lactamase superfamily II)